MWQKGETKGKGKDRKGKYHWAQDSWGKGTGKSKDKRGKNVDKKSFVRCWVYNQFGHHCDDCPIGGRPDNWQPQYSWSGAAEDKESAATASSKAKAKAKASLAPLRTSSIRKLQFKRRAGARNMHNKSGMKENNSTNLHGRERSHKVVNSGLQGLQDDSSHNAGWQDSGWIGGSVDIGTVSQSDERESQWYMVRSTITASERVQRRARSNNSGPWKSCPCHDGRSRHQEDTEMQCHRSWQTPGQRS